MKTLAMLLLLFSLNAFADSAYDLCVVSKDANKHKLNYRNKRFMYFLKGCKTTDYNFKSLYCPLRDRLFFNLVKCENLTMEKIRNEIRSAQTFDNVYNHMTHDYDIVNRIIDFDLEFITEDERNFLMKYKSVMENFTRDLEDMHSQFFPSEHKGNFSSIKVKGQEVEYFIDVEDYRGTESAFLYMKQTKKGKTSFHLEQILDLDFKAFNKSLRATRKYSKRFRGVNKLTFSLAKMKLKKAIRRGGSLFLNGSQFKALHRVLRRMNMKSNKLMRMVSKK